LDCLFRKGGGPKVQETTRETLGLAQRALPAAREGEREKKELPSRHCYDSRRRKKITKSGIRGKKDEPHTKINPPSTKRRKTKAENRRYKRVYSRERVSGREEERRKWQGRKKKSFFFPAGSSQKRKGVGRRGAAPNNSRKDEGDRSRK